MTEMILKAILPNILEIIITIISLVVSYHIIPYIKKDFIPWLKEKRVYSMAKKFVQAAEKIKKADKKATVIKLLEDKGVTVDETTEAFIESCVKELDTITSVVYEEIIEVEAEEE